MQRVLVIICLCFTTALSAQEAWDLERCIQYALTNNITVQQSKLNVDRAEVNSKFSKLNLLPSLNAGATHGYNFVQRIDPFTNQFASERVRTNNLFLSSSLDVFNGFSKMNTMRQNKEDLMASEYDLQNIQNDISMQVCLAYLRVLLAKETLTVNQNQVNLTSQQVDRMAKLVDAGQMPRGNLYDLQSQLAQEELNVVTSENSVNLELLTLTQLLQLEPEVAAQFDIVKPDLSDKGVELMSQTPQDIYIRAKQSLPEVQAAEARQRSAEYALSSSKGNLYPSLQLSGSLGSGYSGINDVQVGDGTNVGFVPIGQVSSTGEQVITLQEQTVFGDEDFETKPFSDQLADNFNQNLQLTLSIPIFNGWFTKSTVERAKIDQVNADLNYRQVTTDLRFDVEQSYADAKAAMNTYIASEKAVSALQESFKYAI